MYSEGRGAAAEVDRYLSGGTRLPPAGGIKTRVSPSSLAISRCANPFLTSDVCSSSEQACHRSHRLTRVYCRTLPASYSYIYAAQSYHPCRFCQPDLSEINFSSVKICAYNSLTTKFRYIMIRRKRYFCYLEYLCSSLELPKCPNLS